MIIIPELFDEKLKESRTIIQAKEEKEEPKKLDYKRGKFFLESFLSINELKKPENKE